MKRRSTVASFFLIIVLLHDGALCWRPAPPARPSFESTRRRAAAAPAPERQAAAPVRFKSLVPTRQRRNHSGFALPPKLGGLGFSGLRDQGPARSSTALDDALARITPESRPHQREAVAAALKHWLSPAPPPSAGGSGGGGGGDRSRALVVLPPGTGKTMLGLWCFEALAPTAAGGTLLVVTETLPLIDQTVAGS